MSIDDNYQALAIAIVQQAIKDYKNWTRGAERTKSVSMKKWYENQVLAVERFFMSEWCYELTGIEGERILAEAKRRARGKNRVRFN